MEGEGSPDKGVYGLFLLPAPLVDPSLTDPGFTEESHTSSDNETKRSLFSNLQVSVKITGLTVHGPLRDVIFNSNSLGLFQLCNIERNQRKSFTSYHSSIVPFYWKHYSNLLNKVLRIQGGTLRQCPFNRFLG